MLSVLRPGKITLRSIFIKRMASTKTVYDFTVKDIDGNDVSLEKYKGSVLIIFNGACKCGLTEVNYKQLQQLYLDYQDKGLKILGFPSNQFASQEPWPEAEIKKFVMEKYNVTFDMFSKVEVNGKDTCDLFKFLKESQGGTFGSFIKWNFTKFLVDKEGIPRQRYSPRDEPNEIRKDLPKYL